MDDPELLIYNVGTLVHQDGISFDRNRPSTDTFEKRRDIPTHEDIWN